MNYNQDIWRLIKEKVEAEINAAKTAAETAAATELAKLTKGQGDNLPAAADFVGQLFVKTGATNPGLYISTGTTTPGWKAVATTDNISTAVGAHAELTTGVHGLT